jgi:hypothetical protein
MRSNSDGELTAEMTKHVYEKPQNKNLHKLTVRQHVFPSASIARFCNSDGGVSLCDKVLNTIRPATPDDVVFCAKRAWDQRAESGYMKSIEDEFQVLALKIIEGSIAKVGEVEKHIVNYFYALWYMRARYRNLSVKEIHSNGVEGSKLTQNEEEILEKNHVAYTRLGGKIPARTVNGLRLQALIDGYANDLLSTQWGIIRAEKGEFIVPDRPEHTIVPLTPILCLVSPSMNGTIVKNNVAEINKAIVKGSGEYYFSRDFSSCP